MTGRAILVTGSRDWFDERVIAERLARYPRGTIMLHGGAVGADMRARRVADERGFVVVRVPYFDHLGPRGGPVRNQAMVGMLCGLRDMRYRVEVEAFPRGPSPGTRGCVRYAAGAGLTVHVTEGT